MDKMQGETVRLDRAGNRLLIVDQTRFPNEKVVLELQTLDEMVVAIQTLQVRGAPAIGVAAALGLSVLAGESRETDAEKFKAEFLKNADAIKRARPTAVNLAWAVGQMRDVLQENPDVPVPVLKELLYQKAQALHDADVAVCRAIGENGAPLLKTCKRVLTHCNAGRLATVKYGTALAPVYVAKEQGHSLSVYADETRPLLQGARLTAYELCEAGIETTVLCDNMASYVMGNGLVDAVLVGCDRVAANGDTANKIGTSGVAILAKYYHIPFYVCAPFSTMDLNTETGKDIPIEMRNGEEIRSLWYQKPMVPAAAKTLNPAFDITPHELVTAFITEKGVLQPEDFKTV